MNQLSFSLKRSYYASLRLNHQVLRPFGITPARFDMLRYVAELGWMTQRELTSALGVSAPTVSRMLKALVQLGLVDKSVALDARSRSITLTPKGNALVTSILSRVVGSGAADLLQNAAGSWSHSPSIRTRHITRFLTHLRWVRLALGDTSIRFDSCPFDIDASHFREPAKLLHSPDVATDRLFGIGGRSQSRFYSEPFRSAA